MDRVKYDLEITKCGTEKKDLKMASAIGNHSRVTCQMQIVQTRVAKIESCRNRDKVRDVLNFHTRTLTFLSSYDIPLPARDDPVNHWFHCRRADTFL